MHEIDEVTAHRNGVFLCPKCNAENGAQSLAQHGIDYVGQKLPNDHRLAFCVECGHAFEVDYPSNSIIPSNPSFHWEACKDCHGDHLFRSGPDSCDSCTGGGFWIETHP